jgi:hypothetical protein
MSKKISVSTETLNFLINDKFDDSCKAIIAHTFNLPVSGWLRKKHPANVESIRNCRLMLEQSPEIVEAFPACADLSPEWAALVKSWESLCSTMDAECPNWRQTLWQNGAWQGQGTKAILQRLS